MEACTGPKQTAPEAKVTSSFPQAGRDASTAILAADRSRIDKHRAFLLLVRPQFALCQPQIALIAPCQPFHRSLSAPTCGVIAVCQRRSCPRWSCVTAPRRQVASTALLCRENRKQTQPEIQPASAQACCEPSMCWLALRGSQGSCPGSSFGLVPVCRKAAEPYCFGAQHCRSRSPPSLVLETGVAGRQLRSPIQIVTSSSRGVAGFVPCLFRSVRMEDIGNGSGRAGPALRIHLGTKGDRMFRREAQSWSPLVLQPMSRLWHVLSAIRPHDLRFASADQELAFKKSCEKQIVLPFVTALVFSMVTLGLVCFPNLVQEA